MKLFVNQKEFNTDSATLTVEGLLKEIQVNTATGIAVAVNNKVVRKTDRDSTLLNDGDNVTIITAVCGG